MVVLIESSGERGGHYALSTLQICSRFPQALCSGEAQAGGDYSTTTPYSIISQGQDQPEGRL